MEDWIPLLSGLIGALIGSGTTIITLWLKERWAYRSELRKLALEMATADYRGQVEVYRDRPNFVTPLPVLVNYYQQLTRAAENGKLDATTFKKLAEERHDLSQANIY